MHPLQPKIQPKSHTVGDVTLIASRNMDCALS